MWGSEYTVKQYIKTFLFPEHVLTNWIVLHHIQTIFIIKVALFKLCKLIWVLCNLSHGINLFLIHRCTYMHYPDFKNQFSPKILCQHLSVCF